MFVLFLQYVPYQEGDEDIVLSGLTTTMVVYQHDNLFPGMAQPAVHGEVNVGFHLRQDAEVTLSLFDIQGREVKQWIQGVTIPSGRHLETLNVDGLPSGTYIYRMRTSTGTVRSAQLCSDPCWDKKGTPRGAFFVHGINGIPKCDLRNGVNGGFILFTKGERRAQKWCSCPRRVR